MLCNRQYTQHGAARLDDDSLNPPGPGRRSLIHGKHMCVSPAIATWYTQVHPRAVESAVSLYY